MASGTGSATIHATASANSGAGRSTSATIAGHIFSATQSGVSLVPVPRVSGAGRTSGVRLQ
jgi:hypothetical protein